MTLQSNEVVYTADLMNISPANDAQIYGMSGNWILNGLSVVSSNATSITLSAGRAVIQGRLFELKANTEYQVNSQAGFIGIGIDLTQTNSEDDAGVVQNNQFTVGFGAKEFGDTLQGDVNAFVGLYAVDGKGKYTQHTFNYYRKETQFTDWGYGYFQDYSDYQKPTAIRQGRTVTIYGAVKNKYRFGRVSSSGKPETGIFRVLPVDMRPPMQVITLEQGSQNSIFMLKVDSNGEMSILRGRTGGNDRTFPAGSWFNIFVTYNIEY